VKTLNLLKTGLSALLIVASQPLAEAATISFAMSTDAVFRLSNGETIASGTEARVGYFSDTATSTAYSSSEIIALAGPSSTPASSSMAALDAKFRTLATAKFSFNIVTAGGTTVENIQYSSADVPAGMFYLSTDSFNTQPQALGFDTASSYPYLYIKSGSEFMVLESLSRLPSGIGLDSAGSWGINGLLSVDEFDEPIPATAAVVGSLGSLNLSTGSFSTIPEPSALTLLTAGTLLCVCLRRKLKI
jgi:hypothetical protein